MNMVRIGDACEILNGFAFKSENYVDSGIRIIRIANVQKGFIEDNKPVFYPIDSEDIDKYVLDEGDLLMSLTGNVGRVAILTKEFLPAALNQRVACLRMKSDKILKRYLFHILNSDFFEHQCIQSSKGVAQKNMSTEWLKEYEIPLYSQNDQKEIIDILDKTLAIITERQCQLRTLDTLIKARFVEMFGEETEHGVPLRECCIDVRGGGTPSMQHPEYYGGNVPFIKSGDVREDMVSSGALWLTEKALAETTAKYVPQGSVLVVNRSAALLREFRAAIAACPVVINQDIKAFIPKHDYTSEYLLWAIKIQTQLLLTKVTTVLTSHIDLKDLLELRIANASIERQKEFSAFISQVNKSKVVVQQALEKAQLLFDSLMQKYFG